MGNLPILLLLCCFVKIDAFISSVSSHPHHKQNGRNKMVRQVGSATPIGKKFLHSNLI